MIHVYFSLFGVIFERNVNFPKRKKTNNEDETPIKVKSTSQEKINFSDEIEEEENVYTPTTDIELKAKRFEEELKSIGIYDIPNASDLPPTYGINDDVEIITDEFEKEQQDMIERRRYHVSNEVQLLEPKLQRFVHLYLTGQYNQTQLAQLLEVHKNTINSWLKREDVNIAIKEYQAMEHEMIDVQIKAMRMKAIEKMNELMDSPIDGIAFQACKDILDRTGHKAKNEIKVDKTVKTIEMQLNDLAENLITDVDFTEL